MNNEKTKIRSIVRREHADGYLLTSLVVFGATVIFTRLFLQLTGFPQIGNSVLHIAHALWGGLLLFVAVLLPLAMANRWALQLSAILSGLGIGLFIDEVGKFITQANDYFFPPALSLIYGFFLICVFFYLLFRRSSSNEPRRAMYHALEGLQEILDGDMDKREAGLIESHLEVAKRSDREELASLASVLSEYLEREKGQLLLAEHSNWKRSVNNLDSLGQRIGRRTHHTIVSGILIFWLALVVGYIAILVLAGPSIDDLVIQWRAVLLVIQVTIGTLMFIAVITWFLKDETRGLKFGISGFLVSLITLQLHYFYISQLQQLQPHCCN